MRWGLAVLWLAAPAFATAQEVSTPGRASHLIIPQTRSFAWQSGNAGVKITRVDAIVAINEQVATTAVTVSLTNSSSRRLEAEVLMPVPDGVAVRGFTFQGAASEPTAELLPRDEARRIYNQIVAKTRDPALLEFAGFRLIRSSVFPVEAQGEQKVRITYEQLLTADGSRVDYVLPRSQSVANTVPWNVAVRLNSRRGISTAYSPSHRLETSRSGAGAVTLRIAPSAQKEPGAFRLSYLLDDGGVSASLMAYPDPEIGGGYFLMLAGLPAAPERESTIKREVTIVLDRSGSMNGEKIRQAREAARQVIAGLEDGETFNLIVYNEAVDVFSEKAVVKSDATEKEAFAYIDAIRPRGGTNIHDALLESLRQKPGEDTLPIVLFLTDGLPTIGQTSEVAIRDVAKKANPYQRRIFTFGVGVDVNTPLLENIADHTRARATFVLPSEDVELKVGQVFKRLDGPVLADTKITVLNGDGEAGKGRVHDMLPARLPDLFRDDQLVLLGQYRNDDALTFEVSGNYLGAPRKFRFDFNLANATTRNAFVPRLWASRKIAVLIDAIRQLGANGNPLAAPKDVVNDPRAKELITEIVRLSREFGILTEYTAFLAREGTDLSRPELLALMCASSLDERAVKTRAGVGAVNQSLNLIQQKGQRWANPAMNKFYDSKLNLVEITNIQQVSAKCFFSRGGAWIDSGLVDKSAGELKADREIDFASPEFFKLVADLSQLNRQAEIALKGDILLTVKGETIRVKNPRE